MESHRHLVQVIQEMRNEIKKLESENLALRGELSLSRADPGPADLSSGFHPRTDSELAGEEEASDSPAAMRRNISAPVLEEQLKEKIIMTVRRYSVSSTPRSTFGKKNQLSQNLDKRDNKGDTNAQRIEEESCDDLSPIAGKQEAQKTLNASAREKFNNRRLLKDYVQKCRTKVKTVTFLLPMDDNSFCNGHVSKNYKQD
ncbi:CC195 protein, partial [Polypterus senegalus]